MKEFIEQGISSQTVIKGLRRASGMAVNKIKEITADTPAGSQRETLRKLAATAMTSKLINRNSDFFTKSKSIAFYGAIYIMDAKAIESGCRCCLIARSG